jgi:hypothetical protein
MIKLSIGIFFLIFLFQTNIQANNETNINFQDSKLNSFTIAPIIPDIIPAKPIKNENWNEYIVISGSNFANNQKENEIKLVAIQNSDNSNIYFSISAFLFTITFIILMLQ